MEREQKPKVEIINEVTITSTSTTDIDGNCDKEVTKVVSNRINLEGLSEDFLRDYFELKVTLVWPDGQGKREIPPEQK